ncbi:MAG: hypothetical protein PHC64_01210 [Candidatus Gastranaerophilales bacterium]|nr:hypothetical protein [Candidatus Gastranaerophilales bacterium]
MYNNHLTKNKDINYDECGIKGICSISPTLVAMKALIFAYLQELAFYILKLHSFGARNKEIKNKFIETFSILTANSEYSEESFQEVIIELNKTTFEVKALYKKLCFENKVTPIFFKSQVKLGSNFSLPEILKQGQKCSDKFKKDFNEQQKKTFDIILLILKSMCIYIVELQELNIDIDKYYKEILIAICLKELRRISFEEQKELMKKYAELDFELMWMVFETRKKEFGELIKTELRQSQKIGKAILAAGTNLKELELLLQATKDRDIDVYTHGQMITAHTFPKFKSCPNLAGHWGKGTENYLQDFTSFPGPIFLTKLSLFKVENLCSCNIYVTDKIASKGVRTIKDYDFEEIIKSAHMSEGFEEEVIKENIPFGIIEQDFVNEINKLAEKIDNNEIKTIFTIGVSNKVISQADYFKRFFKLLPDDCFVLSFYYTDNSPKVLLSKIDYAYPYLYKTLEIISETKNFSEIKVNILHTRCESHTFPNLINLKRMGFENVYMAQCLPTLINPGVIDFICETFNIKRYTTPESDLQNMIVKE